MHNDWNVYGGSQIQLRKAVETHLELSREYGNELPEVFDGEYHLVFRFNAEYLIYTP